MLFTRFPLIIARSAFKARQAREDTQKEMVQIAQDRSRVDTGEMRAGWEDEDDGAYEGIVFNLVSHTIDNEYGTVNMSAQPMLRPAIEQCQPKFEDRLRGIFR